MRTSVAISGILVLVAGLASAGAVSANSAPHSSRPGNRQVELVGEGVVSTGRNETFPMEDPVDGDLWFSVYERGFNDQTIMVARRQGAGWGTPEVAPFSGTWGDRAPRFAPDGSELYFTSNRPVDGKGEPGDMNIWRVERSGDGWGDPSLVEPPVSSPAPDIHVAVTPRGFWVPSSRDGTLGRSDIFRVDRQSREVVHLPGPVNDEHSQPDLWVSPDETWMILVVTDHPSGHGGDDLYLSRFGEAWSVPENLGPEINSPEYEYGPSLSRDGEWLYFTSHRAGSADVYRVPVDALPR